MSLATGNELKLTDRVFEQLRNVIYERSGIHFQESKKYVLESRLGRRLEELEFTSYDQYVLYLTTGPYQHDEFQEMFNRITINETSFFRNEPQLRVFETKVLPQLLESRKDVKKLRIWSAACSTGEEPYTLAIQIHRSLGIRIADWKIEILGTDISEKVLKTAVDGRYTSYSIRSTPATVLSRYFKKDGEMHEIDPEIRSLVHFELHNLRDVFGARRFGAWDVIFCRNVMIYFDDEMKRRVVGMFHTQLADEGMLFIGHSESLRSLDVPLDQMPDPRAFAYVKRPVAGGSLYGL